MRDDIQEVLFSEEEIQAKIIELGKQVTADYDGKFPLLVGVLKGVVPFFADLVKRIDTHLEMDFMVVSSYGSGTTTSGEVKIVADLNASVEGRDILIVEDIIDSGLTLHYLADLFRYRQAKSVKIITLLDKPSGRRVDITPDYYGFSCPDEFLVGYGLDYAERYRNLAYVGILKSEVYAN